MPKRLLQVQSVIFRLLPSRLFHQEGLQKRDFISLTRSMEDLDFRASLAGITCPTLILYGGRDYLNKRASFQLAKSIPNSKLLCIPDAGHEVNEDQHSPLQMPSNLFTKTSPLNEHRLLICYKFSGRKKIKAVPFGTAFIHSSKRGAFPSASRTLLVNRNLSKCLP